MEVLELAPTYVQTELGGASQATDPAAMPLADFIAEVMQILSTPNPPHGEILVERSKAYRAADQPFPKRQRSNANSKAGSMAPESAVRSR